ncbi:hypothetical protein P8452_53265 [Trifolium repens]|nr:hypothetical protein P8452_53265 [Trifolium repens]
MTSRPKRDWLNPKPKPKTNPLKPLPDWMLHRKPLREMSKELVLSHCYKGIEDLINQSPYDADPPTLEPKVFGGNPVYAIHITDEVRPILEKLSHLALECYNNNKEGASYEFHDLSVTLKSNTLHHENREKMMMMMICLKFHNRS